MPMETETGRPVADFDMEYTWQLPWKPLFDEQIKLLGQDIARRRMGEDRSIIYLSCPISSFGGGFMKTNIDIARFTQRRLQNEWGERVWLLNPAEYQLESKNGTGLFVRHAEYLNATQHLDISVEKLMQESRPSGGDYMRMWTKTLVEDDGPNVGGHFDAFYFIGPSDALRFFTANGEVSATQGIENYFGRKMATDAEFRDHFSNEEDDWDAMRRNFCSFYILRASANFSKGCHDEWNIFRALNAKRIAAKGPDAIGGLLGGFFDGKQIDPGATVTEIDRGYARVSP